MSFSLARRQLSMMRTPADHQQAGMPVPGIHQYTNDHVFRPGAERSKTCIRCRGAVGVGIMAPQRDYCRGVTMPAQHKQYDRGAPRSSRRIPVGPAVPTVFLLAGQLVCDACSDDWGELWIHREIPLDRIAMNWSGDRQDLKFLCEDEDVVDHYDSDHSFWLDIVELCRWAYMDLAEDHQQMVRAATAQSRSCSSTDRPASKRSLRGSATACPSNTSCRSWERVRWYSLPARFVSQDSGTTC